MVGDTDTSPSTEGKLVYAYCFTELQINFEELDYSKKG